MSLTWTLNGVDKSSTIRLTGYELVESAFRGEIGAGSFLMDDTTGTYTPPAMKNVVVEESSASPTRMFSGYIAERTGLRGDSLVTGSLRQWRVTAEDVNAFLDDRVIGSGGNRPQETDYQRINWLIGASGALSSVSAGSVPNTNTVTMDAIDYRSRSPREVLDDCAQKSGKNFFLYDFGAGTKLYYDLPSGTALTSSLQISDNRFDVDGVTCFAASNVTINRDPSRIFSTVRLRYKRGTVSVTKASTESRYRHRVKHVTMMKIKTHARAVEQANKWLNHADTESVQVEGIEVKLPAAKVNDIRAGQRIQVKLEAYDFSAFTYFRVVRRTVRAAGNGDMASDVEYIVTLDVSEKHKSTRFSRRDSGGPHAGEYVDDEFSNADENYAASVIIDRSGIAVTAGAISITNAAGTVILDGTTDFWAIVATGLITCPINTARGARRKAIMVNTGLSVDPVCFGSIKRADNDGDWAQMLPVATINLAGQVINQFSLRARAAGNGRTEVQAIKETSNPPLAARNYRFYVMNKTAI